MDKQIIMVSKQIKLLYLLCLLLFSGSCATKSPSVTAFKYQISGRIEGSQDGDTLLLGVLGNPRRINKAIIKDSKFEFKGIAPELSIAFIQYRRSFEITGKFVLEDKPILMEARINPEDPEYASGQVVKGGKQNQYLRDFLALQEPIKWEGNEAQIKFQQAQATNNLEEVKFYREKNLDIQQKRRLIRERFIKNHPDAIYSLYDYYNHLDYKFLDLEKTLAILNLFDAQVKNTSLWKKVKELAELEAKK